MKFDVVRAWKDETYRQTLNDEQLNSIPANPVGGLELSDDELETVFGGGYGVGIATASHASASRETLHSYALICEINIFSLNVDVLNLNLINIGNSHTQICIHHD